MPVRPRDWEQRLAIRVLQPHEVADRSGARCVNQRRGPEHWLQMATKLEPLLCELHAHTTWSDGSLTVRELCDLYGRAGFDVLVITDHTTRGAGHLRASTFPTYLQQVAREAERAEVLYGLLVIPGLELTDDDPDPSLAAHTVAVGPRAFVGVADGLEMPYARHAHSGRR